MDLFKLINTVTLSDFDNVENDNPILHGCFKNTFATLKTYTEYTPTDTELIYKEGFIRGRYDGNKTCALDMDSRARWLGHSISNELIEQFDLPTIAYMVVYEMTATMGFLKDEETREYKQEIKSRERFAGQYYNCNKCEEDITRGFRYHCKDCPDYDMCEECFTTFKHEHEMVTIPASWMQIDIPDSDSDFDDELDLKIESIDKKLESIDIKTESNTHKN